MPTIPISQGPQVQSRALPTPMQGNIDVSSGLQAVARGIGQAGDVLDKVQEREAETEAWKAQVEINDRWRAWRDKATTEMQGEKAKGFKDLADGWWADAQSEYAGKLSPRAQRMIGKSLATLRGSALDHASGYETQQLEVANTAAFNENLNRLTGAAVSAGPAGADKILADAEAVIRARGAQKGIPVDSVVLAAQSSVHEQIVRQLVRGNQSAAAQTYFEAHRKQIDPKRTDEILGFVEDGKRKVVVQSFADETMRTPGITLEAALADARTRFTGDDETAAVQEVKTRFAEVEAGETLAAKKLAKSGWSEMMSKGSVSRLDPVLVGELKRKAPEELRQMRDWEDAKRRQDKAEREGTTDPDELGRFYAFVRMAQDEPSKFANTDLTKAIPYVSKAQWNHLVTMQTGISKNDAKAMEQQRQVKQTINSVRGSILAAGIDLTPKEGTPQAKAYANFMGSLTQSLTEAQAAQPDKPLTPDQMKKIGMDMLRVGYEQKSGIFGFGRTKKLGYEIVSRTDSGKTYISTPYNDIPPDIRAELEADAPRTGTAGMYGTAPKIDKDAIERAYQRGVEEGRFK